MSKLTMDDLTPGESWGCRFRTHTFCDDQGVPVRSTNLQLGQAHPGTPQEYTSWGVIHVRDTESRRLSVIDNLTGQEFVIDEDNAWDYDRVEYVE